MLNINAPSVSQSALTVRILRLNTDKTRKMIGSDTLYQAFFELSQSPPQLWRIAFEREWKSLNAGQPLALLEMSVERAFLIVTCPLRDIAGHLPALKKAVAAANVAYEREKLDEDTSRQARENFWTDERKAVEQTAETLHFD